jgi:hypothetical protein
MGTRVLALPDFADVLANRSVAGEHAATSAVDITLILFHVAWSWPHLPRGPAHPGTQVCR